MTKLNGVKTLDMQNGEITRIEYEGAVYTKVANDFKDAQTGDIFFYEGRDAYYEILIRESDLCGIPHPVRFKEDDGSDNGYMRGCNAHPLYRKVAAELTVGDRVKALRSGEFRDIARGEYVVIVDTEFYRGDDPYYIEVKADSGVMDFFRPQDLELVEIEPLKAGDYAVITGKGDRGRFHSHQFDIGEVAKITRGSSKGDRMQAEHLDGRDSWYVYNGYMRKATDAEVAATYAKPDHKFAKAERNPNEYRKGDLVHVLRDVDHPELVGKVAEVTEHYGDAGGGNVVMKNGEIILGEDVEIVCFAEDRKDVA